MKMTDGKRTVEIEILEWNGTGYDPDWSRDYFNAGSLEYCEDDNTYVVNDVDYCVEIADDPDDPESAVYGEPDMEVWVTELPNATHYRIKPEYFGAWGATFGRNVVSEAFVRDMAQEWETPVETLLEQLELIG